MYTVQTNFTPSFSVFFHYVKFSRPTIVGPLSAAWHLQSLDCTVPPLPPQRYLLYLPLSISQGDCNFNSWLLINYYCYNEYLKCCRLILFEFITADSLTLVDVVKDNSCIRPVPEKLASYYLLYFPPIGGWRGDRGIKITQRRQRCGPRNLLSHPELEYLVPNKWDLNCWMPHKFYLTPI